MPDWDHRLRTGVGMGLTAEAFWRLSWREWRMLNAPPPPVTLDRDRFNALMAQFPDQKP